MTYCKREISRLEIRLSQIVEDLEKHLRSQGTRKSREGWFVKGQLLKKQIQGGKLAVEDRACDHVRDAQGQREKVKDMTVPGQPWDQTTAPIIQMTTAAIFPSGPCTSSTSDLCDLLVSATVNGMATLSSTLSRIVNTSTLFVPQTSVPQWLVNPTSSSSP